MCSGSEVRMKKSFVASTRSAMSRKRTEFRSASSRGVMPSRSAAWVDRLAVLVGAREEEDVLPALAHVAGQHVRRDRRVRVAEMRLRVHVVDRRRDVVGHRGRCYWRRRERSLARRIDGLASSGRSTPIAAARPRRAARRVRPGGRGSGGGDHAVQRRRASRGRRRRRVGLGRRRPALHARCGPRVRCDAGARPARSAPARNAALRSACAVSPSGVRSRSRRRRTDSSRRVRGELRRPRGPRRRRVRGSPARPTRAKPAPAGPCHGADRRRREPARRAQGRRRRRRLGDRHRGAAGAGAAPAEAAPARGAGATAGDGSGAGAGGASGGRKSSGSRYAWPVPASRTPKCRCGSATDRRPLTPDRADRLAAATGSPSRTAPPTGAGTTGRSSPSAVRSATVSPRAPTAPAYATRPAAAATTACPPARRCRPRGAGRGVRVVAVAVLRDHVAANRPRPVGRGAPRRAMRA